MLTDEIVAALARQKAVPVIRASRLDHAMRAAEWLAEAGMTVVEMTLTTPDVFDGLTTLSRDPKVIAGAGTILSPQDARLAIASGAQFIVTPCWIDGVIDLARDAGVPAFIGAANPSEIWRAHTSGAGAVKIFPAATLGGPAFLKQVRAVFPSVPVMPTGGVTVDTAADYLAAGAFCVGLGSELCPARAIEAGDKAGVIARARGLLARLSPPDTIAV